MHTFARIGVLPHSGHRRRRLPAAQLGRWDSSSAELSCDLLSTDRRAHFREEPVRFAKLSLVGDVVAGKPRQRGALEIDVWLEPPRAGFPDQSERAVERSFDRGSGDQTLGTPTDAR